MRPYIVKDGAKRIKTLRNAVHRNRLLEVQQSSAMSKDTRSDEVVRDHGIRRHWSEKPAGVLEGASPEQNVEKKKKKNHICAYDSDAWPCLGARWNTFTIIIIIIIIIIKFSMEKYGLGSQIYLKCSAQCWP